jgi:RNA polymerase sigma-70 factor (ECF subfamily)
MAEPGEPSAAATQGIARLVEQFHQLLYRYALRLTGSIPDAEDLTQQAFLVAQQKADQIRDEQATRAWLFTVLRNCYLKSFRKPVPLTAASLELDVNSIAEEPEVFDVDEERLQGALAELPDEFRLVVLMFYFEEQSYRQIAESLDVPIGTVMSRLSRAKSHLRRRLADHDARRESVAVHKDQRAV